MRIALVGYGKMGKMIEEIALERGHQVVLKLTRNNSEELNESSAKNIDVAIEFTSPESAYGNVKKCLDLGLPVVSGSTGWNEKLETAKEYCQARNGSLLHASNFSIGVNIFFEINKRLAALMANQPEYDVMIREIHHTQKKDAPSGTAVTLAEQIIENIRRKTGWEKEASSDAEKISIVSERIDPAPGTHHVKYSSVIDDIELIHTAHSRKGFAYGAVLAAEYISGKKGIFSMKDVLDL
ncbi:MAG TPA: 4-hydroxy-tetrahydrodipicolinate reductase [Chitinophagaceae bacterium]